MPWKETCAMEQRQAFIDAWLSGEFAMSELCRRFEISRPTGYKWLTRFRGEGLPGLRARSSAPLLQARATSADQIGAIVRLKHRYPNWGPLTIRDWLRREYPEQTWPAVSTTGEILKRHGLVEPRQRRHHTPPATQPFASVSGANDVWSADFKGQFALGDERVCYPLTITDNYSRFLLCCQGLYRPGYARTRAYYERTFREYGLPRVVRTDNGSPFASIAIGGLSALSVWLLKLGVLPERIDPGQPQQNGRHERMHRTLKAATAKPPKANLSAQQRAFNAFRSEYNEERPHRSLGDGRRPHDVYRPSPRPYPVQLAEIEYADDFAVRKVKQEGHMKWHGQCVYITKVLAGEHIALKPLDHDCWELYFAALPLGIFDARTGKVIKPWQRSV